MVDPRLFGEQNARSGIMEQSYNVRLTKMKRQKKILPRFGVCLAVFAIAQSMIVTTLHAQRTPLELFDYCVEWEWTTLHMAAKNGNVDKIDDLLAGGHSVDERIIACNAIAQPKPKKESESDIINRHYDLLQDLLFPDTNDLFAGATALHIAASYDQLAAAQRLIAANSNVNAKTKLGMRPIEFAARNNNVQILNLLIENGTNLEQTSTSFFGMTPMHWAAIGNHIDTARELLKHKVPVNIEIWGGVTAMDFALAHETDSGFGLRELLESHGGECRSFCLMKVKGCENWHTSGFWREATAALVRQCIELGASTWTYFDGSYDLHKAAALSGSPAVVKLLLNERENNYWFTDKRGRTPLHAAVAKNRTLSVIQLLLDEGADVNAQDKRGRTPLHTGLAKRQIISIIKILLDEEADVNVRDNKGNTPLHIAVKRDPKIVKMLLNHRADIGAKNDRDRTPLHIAVSSNGSPGAVKALLDEGADVNARDKFGYTPLHLAATLSETTEIVEILLDAKADPSIKDKKGNTPWDSARRNTNLIGTDVYQRLEKGNRK